MPVADCATVRRGLSAENDVTGRTSDCALCPKCRARLNAAFDCATCGVCYPLLSSVRVLLGEPLLASSAGACSSRLCSATQVRRYERSPPTLRGRTLGIRRERDCG